MISLFWGGYDVQLPLIGMSLWQERTLKTGFLFKREIAI